MANATNMAVVTAAQSAFKEAFGTYLSEGGKKSLSEWQKFVTAVTSGFVCAAVATPFEMVMVRHADNTEKLLEKSVSHPGTMVRPTYLKTMSGVFSRYGYTGFARGMVGTAFRDGGFTGAYMWGADYFAKRFQDQGLKDVTYSALAGGATAGVLGAVVTHPFDTWKTRRQKGLPRRTFSLRGLSLQCRMLSVRLIRRRVPLPLGKQAWMQRWDNPIEGSDHGALASSWLLRL